MCQPRPVKALLKSLTIFELQNSNSTVAYVACQHHQRVIKSLVKRNITNCLFCSSGLRNKIDRFLGTNSRLVLVRGPKAVSKHNRYTVMPASCMLIPETSSVHNDLRLQLWMHGEGISAVDTVSHKAQMSLRPGFCEYWGPVAAAQAGWERGTMENMVLWIIWAGNTFKPTRHL